MFFNLNFFFETSCSPMKITYGICREFAYSNWADGWPEVRIVETLAFLNFFVRSRDSSSWSREITKAFAGTGIFTVDSCVNLSKPNETPTAGIFLFEYFPTRLSKRPPAAMLFFPFCLISKMFPV